MQEILYTTNVYCVSFWMRMQMLSFLTLQKTEVMKKF